MKESFKRHAVSALVTFATGAGMYLLVELDTLTIQSFQEGAYVGVAFAAVRAGIKLVLETLVSAYKKSQ